MTDMRIIFASHHQMATGLKDTVEYIIPNAPEIIDISAYLDNQPVEQAIAKALGDINDDEDVLIFTDLLSGSVNQGFVPYLKYPNVHIISGTNLPVVMAVLLGTIGRSTTPEDIRKAISDARAQLVYVNDIVALQAQADEEDE